MFAFALPSLQSLSDLGYVTLLVFVFLEQAGLPVPAFPILVGAGVLISSGHLSFPLAFPLVIGAALVADLIWYYLGRSRGGHILNLICKISWKPDRCITTTTSLFSRYGDKTLLFAKFVPGLSTLAPPMAGMSRMPLARFFWYDAIGCAVWAAVPLLAGMFLQKLPTPAFLITEARHHLLPLGLVVIGGFVLWRLLWRLFYRIDLHKELKNGLTGEELKAMLDAGDEPVIIDVRHPLSIKKQPVALPRARSIGYKELLTRHTEIPADRLVVVYCDCPTDEGSVAAVQRLRKLGIPKARPLLGGLRGWTERGFETMAFG